MENEAPEVTPPPALESPPTQAPPKRSRLNKWHVVTVVLVAIICLQAFLYLSLATNYNFLDSKHKALLSEHATLEDDHSSLQSNYDSLQSSYSSLQSSYYGLQSSHSSLKADYDSLEASYGSLQSSYNSLQVSHNSLQSSYSSLQTSYNTLQSSFDSYYSDYANLRNLINQRALHLDIMDFITPDDPAVSSIVSSVTGGWSNPSDPNEYWSDVKKMYDWVVNNIDYRYDGLFPIIPSTPSGSIQYSEEMWQFPSETLDIKKGDCEDMAILLNSMILSYNEGKYWVECIWITSSSSGHVGVQFPVTGDKLTILDPAGHYYTQNLDGSLGSKDISTEINNWLNYWKTDMGSDVRVYRVFSDSIDKSFASTSEYTTWLYNR